MTRLRTILAAVAAVLVTAAPAPAQDAPPSMCQAVARDLPGASYARLAPAVATPRDRVRPIRASTGEDPYAVTIRFVGHATFRIVSPEGVIVATDYAGWAGEGPVPTVVTMNHAHSTHYTDNPDPRIEHVLRGWNPDGKGPARHHMMVGDTLVRNVATDIRRWGNVEPYGNSIFIFEIAGLCIGHLGHLHHLPSDEHYAQIGRLDVVMVPIDGGYTMAQSEMAAVVERLRSSIVIPMHFFSVSNLQRFVDRMSDAFAIDMRGSPEITVSLNTLPRQPTVVVLPGR